MKISSSDVTYNSIDYSAKELSPKVDENNEFIPNQKNETGAKNQGEEKKQISDKSVIDAIEKANKIMINHNTRAEFSVHEKTKDIMIKIIDTDSNQVLREYPPKKILDLVARLWELAGLFVDERR